MASEGPIQEITAPVPERGLMEGLDAASPVYDPRFSPDLQNVRVTNGTWQTRAGMTLFKALPGSGDVRGYFDHYEPGGVRVRLAFRGTGTAGALYDLQPGDLPWNVSYLDRFPYLDHPRSGFEISSLSVPA